MLFPLPGILFQLQFSLHLADSYLIYRSQLKHHFLQEAPYTHRLLLLLSHFSQVQFCATP